MTNAVVWFDHDSSKVWAVADSLLTAQTTSAGRTSISRVTDQAMKVLRLQVGAWGTLPGSIVGGPVICYDVGIVYAGAVTPALMTYSAAAMMLPNLHPQTEKDRRIFTPGLAAVADLIRYLSERYTRDASVGYASNRAPFCEFVIFGLPPDDKLNSLPLDCYWIHPKFNSIGEFSQIAERVDLLGGEVAVIGDDTDSLRADIDRLLACPSDNHKGREPRVALEARMRARKHDTVGGTLQFGILEGGRMSLFGAKHDEFGEPVQNWLGFDFKADINSILGMSVKIPSLD
ncbi:hypothetical protein [Serratia plymuthica]|uniref:hypothetical protein n=1 Tax=Serratia plymuthica TaxID=82996 RepID=UPI000AA8E49F|nr:hypothetical protein [Serratia plymuthica]